MEFFIINGADRPCMRLIAAQIGDNDLMYVNLGRDDDRVFSMKQATNVKEFGVEVTEWEESDSVFSFTAVNDSVATYRDGHTRFWQPEPEEGLSNVVRIPPYVMDRYREWKETGLVEPLQISE